MSGEQGVFFDSTPKLRVVDEDKFKDTQALHEECTNFTKSKSRAVVWRWRCPWYRGWFVKKWGVAAGGWRRQEQQACAATTHLLHSIMQQQ